MPGELELGSHIAGYRIEEIAGRGGMGVVYKATQLDLDRPVALKLLAPDVSHDAVFHERFKRESRVAASIDHPNVVPLYEAGEAEGRLFLAMRFVEGTDLGTVLKEGPIPPARAAKIVDQIARALDAAHRRGLVHRDVKPGNILLAERERDEHAYLTDFGLTKQFGPSQGALTATGQFLGTVDYMAPEQIQSSEVDARTDVYALGAVLYQALTGTAPYERDSPMAALYAHMTDPPPVPSTTSPAVPRAFDAVVARAMAKDPSSRYATAGQLGEAAVAAAEGREIRSVPPPPAADATQMAPPPPPATPAPAAEPRRLRRRRRFGARRRGQHTLTAAPPPSLRVPLPPEFTFLHEPLDEDETMPLLGNDGVVESVTRRVAHSKGGSFLVTGFRGVGKTTVVHRAIEGLRDRMPDTVVVPVYIDVAQPKTRAELLFEVIRRLYEELEDTGQLARLRPELQEKLQRAYDRTSMSLTESRARATERSRELGLSAVSAVSPKIGAARRTSDSASAEASFLEYTPADAEHDFRRIVREMGEPPTGGEEPSGTGLIGRMFRRQQPVPRPWAGHVVVVLDELDKLTDQPHGSETVRELITGLKTLLTTRGAHFVFIGGPELHVEALEDRDRGNSVFDSVFSWQAYVPCIWGAEQRLLEALIADPAERGRREVELLRGHLAFWGRGVPRLMLRELNSFVTWEEGRPCLALEAGDHERVEFFAGLENVVSDFVGSHEGADSVHLDVDQWRLAVYYAVEWILRFRVTFTAEDVTALGSGQRIDPLLALSTEEVGDLLEHLEDRGLLRQVTGGLGSQTYYGDEPAAQAAAYEVVEDVGQAVQAFAGAASSDSDVSAELEDAFGGHVGETLAGGRYRLLEELDRSGTGRVYRALDSERELEVAVKVFDLPTLRENERMRTRFLREGAIALELDHPHIVKTYDTFGEEDGRLAIVMALVDGVSLGHRLRSAGALAPPEAVSVACAVLDALDHVNGKGIARLDLRPSSIMVDEALFPVIVNLGLAKHIRAEGLEVTQVGAVLGTPRYAAPEQLSGAPVDIRADLHALALILYELIAGRPARQGDSLARFLSLAERNEVDLSGLEISAPLRAAMARALARDPSERFEDPAAMRRALAASPEGQPLPLA